MATTHLTDDDGDTVEITYFDDPVLPDRRGVYLTVDHGGDECCAGPFTVEEVRAALQEITPKGGAR